MKYFLSSFLLLVSIASSGNAESGFYQPNPGFFSSLGQLDSPWLIQPEFSYAAGKFIGLKEGYGELGVLIAPEPIRDYQLLGDLKAYRLNNGHWASSIGIGTRWWNPSSEQIWGANIFYDYRKAHFANFNRIGLGLELLTECLDYRLNAYFPFDSEKSREVRYEKDPSVFYPEKEDTFAGLDFEVGSLLWKWDNFALDGAAGPYYYHHSDVKSIYGGQVRLGLNWTRYLSFEARASFDNVFKTNVQGKITLSIPLFDLLCCRETDPWRNWFAQPIQRNGVIFTKYHRGEWQKKNKSQLNFGEKK